QGASFIYKGDWARQFVGAVARDGGVITLGDLEDYRVIWQQPTETTYRDARIFAPGLSSVGGVDTIEALNMLELAKLKQHGPPSKSAVSLFRLMQITSNAIPFSYLDSAASVYPGRDFSPAARTTKESARWMWKLAQDGKWPHLRKPAKPGAGHSSGVVA